jgi:nanoRNase/pAp phosphatase (c-di-AMP/oligoRNAs hydrolase)
MALTKEQYKEIRAELEGSRKPLFFFHDDPDGLASFLLMYRFVGRGKGVVVKKSTPSIGEDFLRKVQEYAPDKVFIFDIAIVEQDFINKAGVPVIWIDHHEPLVRESVRYFNPRATNFADNEPTALICYNTVKRDLWIAAAGVVGDWFVPDFLGELRKKYPDLLDESAKAAGDLLFKSRIGLVSKIFSFVLKGQNEDVMRCVKVLTRINDPYEILNQSTSRGRLIFRRYNYINQKYEELLCSARKVKKNGVLVYIYKNKISFTGDLSNELLYLYPNMLVVVGRERQDTIKLSLRSRKLVILGALKKALRGMDAYGGGHEYACGAVVKRKDFYKFVSRLRKNLEL